MTSDRQAEAGVAQAGAGGADQARLGAQQLDPLEQAAPRCRRRRGGRRRSPDPQPDHHMVDRDDAVAADEIDQFEVAPAARI